MLDFFVLFMLMLAAGILLCYCIAIIGYCIVVASIWLARCLVEVLTRRALF
jgi:hypothetical protein